MARIACLAAALLLVPALPGTAARAASAGPSAHVASLSGPIDLRPVPAARKPSAGVRRVMVPPLPRLRPTRAAAAPVPEAPVEAPSAQPESAAPEIVVTTDRPVKPPVRVVGPSLEITGSTEPARPAPPAPDAIATMPTDDIPGDPANAFAEPAPVGAAPPPPPIIVSPRPLAAPAILRPTLESPAAARLPGEPYQLVRTLQSIQDRIAEGSTEALVAQRNLRAQIDEQFLAADPAVWRDRRNAAAAVIYALSGGKPDILLKLSVQSPRPAVDPKLVSGVLAYVEGREIEAREDLADFDVLVLPPSMGAQVALAQSALAVRNDPAKALSLLDTARLLAPGTLVEEAALRRAIFVADQTRQFDKVESFASRYLRRFRHSIYAGNFRIRLAAAISHMDFGKDASEFARLDEMLAAVEPPARGQLYLTVALAAVVRGNAATAALAASRAIDLSQAGSVDEARSRLYQAAGLAVQPKSFDVAVASLEAVDRGMLSQSDLALHEVVTATIDMIASGTDRPAKPERLAVASADGDSVPETASPLIARASRAISATDDLLAKPAR